MQCAGIPQSNGVLAATAIVGRQEDLAFASLMGRLRSPGDVQIIGEFPTLRHAAVAGLGTKLLADVVIVLQSYSDEFPQHEVNDLIGLMLHRRVLCCYGAWCVSDDRTHAIWPIANRAPADSAETVIAMELAEFGRGAPPLSPMAAGEEIFAHRTRLQSQDDSSAGPEETVLIVSDDIALRNTAAQICRRLGRSASCVGHESIAIDVAVQGLSSSLRFILVDLDGQPPRLAGRVSQAVRILSRMTESGRPEKAVLQKAQSLAVNNHNVNVIGMTVFAEPPQDTDFLDAVIDKTELMTQLQWLLSVR